MLERRKDDSLSLAAANLLFKSLNLKMENFLNSPLASKNESSLNIQKSGDNKENSNKEDPKQFSLGKVVPNHFNGLSTS